MSIRAGLPGSENFYFEEFNRLFSSGNYDEASKFVATSPGVLLRNIDTINKFRNLPKPQSGPHPLLKFFFVLLENG